MLKTFHRHVTDMLLVSIMFVQVYLSSFILRYVEDDEDRHREKEGMFFNYV